MALEHSRVTTGNELEGRRVTKNLGLVRGITVRSRSIVGSIGAGLQTIFGGNITLFETLCEQAREQAFDRMLEHAEVMGANAVIGMRYDATDLGQGITEVLAYGTAGQSPAVFLLPLCLNGVYFLRNAREGLRVELSELRKYLTVEFKSLTLKCIDEGAV
jgi:uncharacterized protein YbjQ (UPF0145 family)